MTSPESPPVAIGLDHVTKIFGTLTAVDDLSLSIRPGEVVAFLGPNGAGKTTTIDMVLGLNEPTSGSVHVHGLPPRTAISYGLVSAVTQTGGLLKDLTVGETVELTASLFVPSRPVDEVLERAGILDLRDRRVGTCSGGQQQRLRFAMALLSDPQVLVLDEPTTGMDVAGRREFWSAIREDTGRGRTVLFATHYLEEADAHADRVVLLRQGRIVADGSASQVKAMASDRTVRATLPDADRAELARIPGVQSVEINGNTVLLRARDTDIVARQLLTTTEARDLEVTSQNLEDAFVALTTDRVPAERNVEGARA